MKIFGLLLVAAFAVFVAAAPALDHTGKLTAGFRSPLLLTYYRYHCQDRRCHLQHFRCCSDFPRRQLWGWRRRLTQGPG